MVYQTPTKTPGGTTAQLPFKQATPKHGGIAEIAMNQWAAWTGGAPSNDWMCPPLEDDLPPLPLPEDRPRP